MLKILGRRLADGVTARLEFDFACERGHSFGEYPLHGVVNEIVSANIDPRVLVPHAGYAHPAIAREDAQGPGRKREVDFYIKPRDGDEPSVCIEAKWAGSSHCTWERIFVDLCRLTLVKEQSPTTECLFVLAGRPKKINPLLRKLPYIQKTGGIKVPLLQIPEDEQLLRQQSHPVMDSDGRFNVPKIVREGVPRIPRKVRSTMVKSVRMNTPGWQTIVWRIF